MKLLTTFTVVAARAVFLAFTVLLAGFGPHAPQAFASGEDEHVEEPAKGPHRGRLLKDGNFTVELAIFEQGVPPEYRAWATLDGKVLAPTDWQLQVQLTRLGGQIDHFAFAQQEDFLRGDGEVTEPHSFDVAVTATHNKRKYQWTFPSYEGRIQLSAELAERSGLITAEAGAGDLSHRLGFYGQISHDPATVRVLGARFPGIVKQVNVQVGSTVKAGDILAVIEANDSLRPYNILAPISGTVLERHADEGEITGEQALFTIADPQRLQLIFPIFSGDASRIKVGQPVRVMAGGKAIATKIEAITASTDGTPALLARAALDNRQGHWLVGGRVALSVNTGQAVTALRVENDALQPFRDWQVVFIKVGDTYEIRSLELGRSDGQFTEVLGGLNPGDIYVVGNAYLLKADLEKSGASHDH